MPRARTVILAVFAVAIAALAGGWLSSRSLREDAVHGVVAACTEDPGPGCSAALEFLCWARAGDACRWLAEADRCGRGRSPDFVSALQGYVRACDLGNPRACVAAAEELAAPASLVRSNVTASEEVRWHTALHLAMSAGAWDQALALRPSPADARFIFLEACRALDGGDLATARQAIARVRELEPDDPGVAFFEGLVSEDAPASGWRAHVVRAWLASGRPTHAHSRFLAPVGLMPDAQACYTPFPRTPQPEPDLDTREALLGAISKFAANNEAITEKVIASSRKLLTDGDFAERWIAASLLHGAVEADPAWRDALRGELLDGLRALEREAAPGDPYFSWWRQRFDVTDRSEWPTEVRGLGTRRVEVYRAFLRAKTADGAPLSAPTAFSATVGVVISPRLFQFAKELQQRAEDPAERDPDLFARRICVLGDVLAAAPWMVEQFLATSILRRCSALRDDPDALARAEAALARGRAVYDDGILQAIHQLPLPKRTAAAMEDVVRAELEVYEAFADGTP